MNKYLLTVAVMILISSCSTTYKTVYADYDKTVDFTKYKTFAWLKDVADTTNSPYNNEIIRNNIRNYYGLCLSDRGYRFDPDSPDILIQLVITNAKKQKVMYDYTPSSYYRPYYYGSHYYTPYSYNYYFYDNAYYNFSYTSGDRVSKQIIDYVNGAITLNFIDRKNKTVVWSGTAQGDIYDPSVIKKDLHPAIHRIIEQYPVKPFVKKSHRLTK